MKTDILCKHCGAIVPQKAGRGRPRQYCPDGACQGAAKRERDLRRASPGLEGALARAEDLYDRMEAGLASAIAPLAQVLTDEMSPAGVEAKISAVAAEAAAQVSTARTDREDAFRRLRDAQAEATRVTKVHAEQLAGLRVELDAAREAAGVAADQAERATRERQAAEEQSAEATTRAENAEAAALRDRGLAEAAEVVRVEALEAASIAEAARMQAAREVIAAQAERDMASATAERAETRRTEAVGQAAAAAQAAERALAELAAFREASVASLAEAESATRQARAEAAEQARQVQGLSDRLDDHREQLTAVRAEAAALRERAVGAEMREQAVLVSLRAAEEQVATERAKNTEQEGIDTE